MDISDDLKNAYYDGYDNGYNAGFEAGQRDTLLEKTQLSREDTTSDPISRGAAIDAANRTDYTGLSVEDVKKVTDEVVKELKRLPSAQPDGIPLEWIDKHLEWLDSCDNDFAQLAKVSIRAMVEIWKKDKTR